MTFVADAPPVDLARLTETAAIKRLRNVSQAGAPSLLKPTRRVSRYEHSVGVAALAADLGMSRLEQVAALLHDCTHPAFSHTIDYLTSNRSEDTHEKHLSRILKDPDLTSIVGVPGLIVVVDTIAERPSWLKTLDAIDYTLRDLEAAGLLRHPTGHRLRSALCLTHVGPAFREPGPAKEFVEAMEHAYFELYCNRFDLFLHMELSRILRTALENSLFSLNDLFLWDDRAVLSRIYSDSRLGQRLNVLLETCERDLEPGTTRVHSKNRVVIPQVATGRGGAVALDTILPTVRQYRDRVAVVAERGVPLLVHRQRPSN